MKSYIYLTLAVLLGLVGSSMLKISQGFTIAMPTLLCAISYGFAFYVFSIALQVIPLSTGYAIWSGASTALNGLLGTVLFGESLSLLKITALAMIICGTIVMHRAMAQSQKESAPAETLVETVEQPVLNLP